MRSVSSRFLLIATAGVIALCVSLTACSSTRPSSARIATRVGTPSSTETSATSGTPTTTSSPNFAAKPTYLPAGVFDPRNGAPPRAPRGSPTGLTVRESLFRGTVQNVTGALSVITWSPPRPVDLDPSVPGTQQLTIRGHAAVLSPPSVLGDVSIAWEETPNLEVTVNGRGFTLAELKAVANGLQ